MFTAIVAMAQTVAAQPGLPAFMAGCWGRSSGESWTQECWMEPRAGLMLGASREGKGEKITMWEHTRIERTADGKLAYFASPNGAPPSRFDAREITATSIEFVNAAHDYPQRIRYWMKDGTLEAEISLADGSKPMRWSFAREGSPTAR